MLGLNIPLPAVSRKDLMRPAMALNFTFRIPRPPYEGGLNITDSSGFNNWSAYSQLLILLVILVTSCTLRSTQCVLNHTLEEQY